MLLQINELAHLESQVTSQKIKTKVKPPHHANLFAFFCNQFYINLLMCDNSDNKVFEVRFQGERTHLFICFVFSSLSVDTQLTQLNLIK